MFNGLEITTQEVSFDLLGLKLPDQTFMPISITVFKKFTATKLEDADQTTKTILMVEILAQLMEAQELAKSL